VLEHPLTSRWSLTPAQAEQVDQVCDTFEQAWMSGERPTIEGCLGETPEPVRTVLLDELLKLEMAYRRRGGERPTLAEYRRRFPAYFDAVELAPGEESAHAGQTTTVPHARPDSERVIPGFEVLERLPAGGMGVVSKARDVCLGRVVALKVLRPEGESDPLWLARFRAEARAVAALDHPNVVRLYQYGEHQKRPYLVMEFVAGGSLAQWIRRCPPSAAQAARLLEPLARALHYVHGQGIVHRDLKPANVLLAIDGTPKIADFGLARRLDTDQNITASNAVLGTAVYMAPEQAAGRAR
jgi:serine/threonine-protein kinase